MGDVLKESLYRRPSGGAPPMLLLAAGHRIETEMQLRQLRDEGYTVALPVESSPSGGTTTAAARANGASGPPEPGRTPPLRWEEYPPELARHLEGAARVRQVVAEAIRSMIRSVRAGAAMDMDAVRNAASALLSQTSVDRSALVTLSYLHGCDDYTIEHSADVAILMVVIAQILLVPASELPVLALAGLMHDVGKQRVREELLSRPGALTREEFAEIQKHPQHGFELLASCAGCPEVVRLVALQHHERLDGSGYPGRLTGEQIHPYSRIAAVADTFDAMTSDRVYRRGCQPRTALLELYRDRQRRLDPAAVEALIRVVGVYPVGTRVRLNTGERAVVVAPNPNDSTLPFVRIDRDSRGGPLAVPLVLALDGQARRIAGSD